jgi:hypothetical protein
VCGVRGYNILKNIHTPKVKWVISFLPIPYAKEWVRIWVRVVGTRWQVYLKQLMMDIRGIIFENIRMMERIRGYTPIFSHEQ